jgi:hypothetical protein
MVGIPSKIFCNLARPQFPRDSHQRARKLGSRYTRFCGQRSQIIPRPLNCDAPCRTISTARTCDLELSQISRCSGSQHSSSSRRRTAELEYGCGQWPGKSGNIKVVAGACFDAYLEMPLRLPSQCPPVAKSRSLKCSASILQRVRGACNTSFSKANPTHRRQNSTSVLQKQRASS